MNQTKMGSMIEAALNTLIGYWLAIASQMVILPLFDIHVELATNMGMAACFTGISLARSYIIRRWFNARMHAAAQALAGMGREAP